MEMLRITMSVSGEGATKYFDAALARGQWGGKGAELLGLRGDVSRKDFIALASNKPPGAGETLTVRMKTTRKQKWSSTRKQTLGNRKTEMFLIVERAMISVSRYQSLCRYTLSKPGIGLSSNSSMDRSKQHSMPLWLKSFWKTASRSGGLIGIMCETVH
jgi:TrwC relaxase